MSEQDGYDQAHHPYGRHCLTSPCGWHPGESRIPPPHWYSATLVFDDGCVDQHTPASNARCTSSAEGGGRMSETLRDDGPTIDGIVAEAIEGAVHRVFEYARENTDEIEGAKVALPDGSVVWLHTSHSVDTWLGERLAYELSETVPTLVEHTRRALLAATAPTPDERHCTCVDFLYEADRDCPLHGAPTPDEVGQAAWLTCHSCGDELHDGPDYCYGCGWTRDAARGVTRDGGAS